MGKVILLRSLTGEDKISQIDDEDYDYLMQFQWFFMPPARHLLDAGYDGFAIRYRGHEAGGVLRRVKMHRDIMKAPAAMDVVHVDVIHSLDNRKQNLIMKERVKTRESFYTPNKMNRRNRSGYDGVYWHSRSRKWAVSITVDHVEHFIGYFQNPENASAAYEAGRRKWLYVFQE
jgi:hypothetical protein